jgi:intracellular septation protein
MKFLFDFFPLVLFFIAFQLYDVYVATAVAIAATFAQIGWLKLRRRKVDTMLWVSLAIIVVFGGLTLALHDETFIKWKPTVLYWLFGVILAVSELGLRRNLIRSMLGAQVQLPDFAWRRLNWSWVGFFAFMGAANLWVAFTFPLAIWVKVKVFGGMGMLLLFVLLQAVYLSRHIDDPSTGSGQARPGADDASPPR